MAAQLPQLVVDQPGIRLDDHGRLRQQQAGQLVDDALARSRRQVQQAVPPAQDPAQGRQLPLAERAFGEHAGQQPTQAGLHEIGIAGERERLPLGRPDRRRRARQSGRAGHQQRVPAGLGQGVDRPPLRLEEDLRVGRAEGGPGPGLGVGDRTAPLAGERLGAPATNLAAVGRQAGAAEPVDRRQQLEHRRQQELAQAERVGELDSPGAAAGQPLPLHRLQDGQTEPGGEERTVDQRQEVALGLAARRRRQDARQTVERRPLECHHLGERNLLERQAGRCRRRPPGPGIGCGAGGIFRLDADEERLSPGRGKEKALRPAIRDRQPAGGRGAAAGPRPLEEAFLRALAEDRRLEVRGPPGRRRQQPIRRRRHRPWAGQGGDVSGQTAWAQVGQPGSLQQLPLDLRVGWRSPAAL